MRFLTFAACLLALLVIVLGAYTRLSDAGLGCPDWPGCYGHLTVPKDAQEIIEVEQTFQQPLEAGKAWIEMIHRYCAGILVICIISLCYLSFRKKQNPNKLANKLEILPFIIMAVIIMQALLGMWTVTLKLSPPIILLHLFGGLTILSLLWWFYLNQSKVSISSNGESKLKYWIMIGITLLIAQVGLGGWTSANYAALVCPDFPYCQGQLLPSMDFGAFALNNAAAINNTTLVTIHMMHRIGAVITGSYLIILAVMVLLHFRRAAVKINALVILLFLFIQITLGILNIVWLLPMKTAVTHNMVAALLLLSLLTLLKITNVSNRNVFRN